MPQALLHGVGARRHRAVLGWGQVPQSRFMRAMSGGYARFTFVIVATLMSIHALDLRSGYDDVHSAETTAKFFTGAPHSIRVTSIRFLPFGRP